MKKLWVFLLAVVLLAGCNPPTPPEKPNPPDDQPNGYESSIDDVVDGDTVHLKNPVLGTTKVRMLSIDAPETNYQGKSQGKYGEEAKVYLKQLLPEGTKVKVIPGKQAKDDYGRLLAYIQKGDMDVNREMILQGKAVPYIIYPNFERVQPYLDSLNEAKKDGRGIWNPDDPLEELPYEFRLRVGHRQPDKYAGNYKTKEYVEPDQYKDILIEQRVFFWNEEDAKKAGYKKK
ncbi:thermonuclease family protein [Polycladomyces sp. WAk]|uniref:Thermonuclease family protein n=1 Tax=Polycladomyces zharkentensis TaxID=2807616 RepID=A0ABS2WMY3_9BACL|nr:thermonuclease family protein [Polycladomyces sp. WAk]MBN2910754.1 thermonuclease family protein [Polycladomyces sp. WAk]